MNYDSPFKVTHVSGGVVDMVRKLPYPHFSIFETPFIKGRRLEITQEVTEDVYTLPFPVEFLSIAFFASKHHDKDKWDLYIGDVQVCSDIFVKDLPESVSMGNSFGIVYPIEKDTPIKFVYHTEKPEWRDDGSGATTEIGDPKVVKYNIKFLRDENYEEEEED